MLVQRLFLFLTQKMFVQNLKKVVNVLVADSRVTFIKGKQITEALLIANECLDSGRRQGEVGVMCKLDIEKALIM